MDCDLTFTYIGDIKEHGKKEEDDLETYCTRLIRDVGYDMSNLTCFEFAKLKKNKMF